MLEIQCLKWCYIRHAILLCLASSFLSPFAFADEYSRPTYIYRWSGYEPYTLANAFWNTPQLLRNGIQSYIDSKNIDELLGPMEQSLPMWTVNNISYSWVAKSYKKSTGQLLPGGIGGGEMWVVCPIDATLVGGASIGPPLNPGPYSNLIGYCQRVDNTPEPDNNSCGYGNPIHPETALKVQTEIDYTSPFGLSFSRTYRSDTGKFTNNYEVSLQDHSTFGVVFNECKQRNTSFYHFLSPTLASSVSCFNTTASGEKKLVLNRGGIGRKLTFASDTLLPLTTDNKDTIVKLTDGSGVFSGWRVKNIKNDSTETYSTDGRLLSITNRAGLTQTLTYNGTQLTSVSDAFGRSLQLTYDTEGRLNKMTDPSGQVYTYEYDVIGNLVKVNYPANEQGVIKSRLYHYEDINHAYFLIGITDENGQRFATFTYDANGKALSTEHAGGVDKYSFDYTQYPNAVTITEPLGSQRTNTYQTILGVARTKSTSQLCSSCGSTSSGNIEYDNNGNITGRVDFKGYRTNYTYDLTRNLETQRIEGLTSAGSSTFATRTISTEWHSAWHLPKRIAEPLKITTYVYHGDNGVSCGATGALCSKTEQPTTDTNGSLGFNATTTGIARIWSYTYNANGKILTENGPRTDVTDVTTYTYYTDTTSTHRIGDLATIKNALGHITTINSYDSNGRPLSVTDPNNVVTTFTYTARGKLKTVIQNGTVQTTYSYDYAQQLTKIELPDSRTYTYVYDDAHRLTGITSITGEKLTYSLDNAGNRLSETLADASGVVSTQYRQVFNALGQLYQAVTAVQGTDAATTYTYDNNGNLLTETTPLNETTSYDYDALNRIVKAQEVLNSTTLTTQYGYNAQDVVTSTQAANGATTALTPNGFGQPNSESSPDRGAVTYTYDSAGNTKTRKDARNITLTYNYDALNRLTQRVSPTTAENVTYTYDANTTLTACTNGKGRLCKVVDQSGTTAFAYDAYGRVTKRVSQIAGITYTSSFAYDGSGHLLSVALPGSGGRSITYNRDSERRVTNVSTLLGGVNTLVASSLTYRPDGQLSSVTLNNGETTSYTYDTGGRRTASTRSVGNASESFTWNLNSLLSTRALSSDSRLYQYDTLQRLSSEGTASVTLQSFTYDANGNRLSNGTNAYTYLANSNLMATRKGVAITRDAAGNHTNNGLGQTYTWDTQGHYTQFSLNGVKKATYLYNYQHQRVQKTLWNGTTNLGTTVYHYDLAGRLLAETNTAGTVQTVYLYDDNSTPLAIVQAANSAYNSTSQDKLVYLQTDHIGTPRLATDAAKRTVWKWESDAFGSTAPVQDPDGDGIATTINLRFAGQYYDAESGLHYNWHRTYDPSLGRYISSDPIGLDGGMNTFGYVSQSPMVNVDPKGLNPGAVAGASIRGMFGGPAGALLGGFLGTAIGGYTAYTLFHDNASITDSSTDNSCDANDPKCSKASKWQLRKSGIKDEHEVKDEYGAKPWSRFDLYACEDVSIVIKQEGTCGISSPIWETTEYRWK